MDITKIYNNQQVLPTAPMARDFMRNELICAFERLFQKVEYIAKTTTDEEFHCMVEWRNQCGSLNVVYCAWLEWYKMMFYYDADKDCLDDELKWFDEFYMYQIRAYEAAIAKIQQTYFGNSLKQALKKVGAEGLGLGDLSANDRLNYGGIIGYAMITTRFFVQIGDEQYRADTIISQEEGRYSLNFSFVGEGDECHDFHRAYDNIEGPFEFLVNIQTEVTDKFLLQNGFDNLAQ